MKTVVLVPSFVVVPIVLSFARAVAAQGDQRRARCQDCVPPGTQPRVDIDIRSSLSDGITIWTAVCVCLSGSDRLDCSSRDGGSQASYDGHAPADLEHCDRLLTDAVEAALMLASATGAPPAAGRTSCTASQGASTWASTTARSRPAPPIGNSRGLKATAKKARVEIPERGSVRMWQRRLLASR